VDQIRYRTEPKSQCFKKTRNESSNTEALGLHTINLSQKTTRKSFFDFFQQTAHTPCMNHVKLCVCLGMLNQVLFVAMSDEAQLNSSLNLMRRLPPSAAENSLAGLIEIAPQLTDELLTHVDQPLKVHKDPKAGKYFVQCDYNRDGDSYRCAVHCFTQRNIYLDPRGRTNIFPLWLMVSFFFLFFIFFLMSFGFCKGFKLTWLLGFLPSKRLRELEITANSLFDTYRKL